MRLILVLFISFVSSLPASALDKAALKAQIEAGGRNEFNDERHSVQVDECQLTTFRWKQVENEGWVLWTSFEFPMVVVDLHDNLTTPEIDYYTYLEAPDPMTLILFKGQEGIEFSHEKPFLRKPKGEFTRSKRGDGTTHYIEYKSEGLIIHMGPDVREKAEMFTNGYIQYRQKYCMFIG